MILIGFMKQFIYLCSIRYAQMYMSTCTVYTYQSIELTAILATIHMLGSNTHTQTIANGVKHTRRTNTRFVMIESVYKL